MLSNLVQLVTKAKITAKISAPTIAFSRNYVAPPKRFYRNTNVLQSNDNFEISLDQRKLKTPGGKTFFVNSEALAIAVAAEWNAQKEVVDRSSMHLTSLCNTVIDNPNHVAKPDLVNYLLNYIQTDTVLFFNTEEQRLLEMQQKEWAPIINWFNKEFETDITPSTDLAVPEISPQTKMNVSRYLNSFDLAALHGFVYSVDTIKSLLLTVACVKQYFTVEKAVLLSRLEQEFQLKHWSRVEWAHDLDQQELQARLAAAVFFIYCNTSSHLVKKKIQ